MPWLVKAICNSCGMESKTCATRTKLLAHNLKQDGWNKGDKPGEIYCPQCAYLIQRALATHDKIFNPCPCPWVVEC